EHDAGVGRVIDLLGGSRNAHVLAEVALDEPLDLVREPHARSPDRLAELPRRAVRVDARVEALGRREVVLGLRGIADLAADAREPELAHVVALVRVADEVELAAAEEQVVRIHLARANLVPAEPA